MAHPFIDKYLDVKDGWHPPARWLPTPEVGFLHPLAP